MDFHSWGGTVPEDQANGELANPRYRQEPFKTLKTSSKILKSILKLTDNPLSCQCVLTAWQQHSR